VLGATVARRLARPEHGNHEVVVFEASDELGGLASAWELGDVRWDRHYHVTLSSDEHTRAMYDDLGLADRVRWVETKTGYYGTDGRLRSVSSPVEFLRVPGLRLIDKLRIGLTIAYGSQVRDGERMERIGVEPWLRRWSGDRAFEVFWKPLLRAKLGDQYDVASAAFIWATIRRLFAARRAGLEQELFGYVEGGYAVVFDRFHEALTADGVDVRLACPVREIRRADSGLEVRTAAGVEQFDRVVLTTAAPLTAALCPDLLDGERRRLEEVSYIGIVCASLLLERPLDEYYLTYITDPATPFTAVVEMTALIDPAELGGRSLVYLPKYTTEADPLFEADDADVVDQFMPYLRTMYPFLTDADVLASRVSRVRKVFAVPTERYSTTMPSLTCSIPGLVTVGSANLPFSTLNVNDVLALADEIIELVGGRSSGPEPSKGEM
jgi:protoporphyrinogen oxidase